MASNVRRYVAPNGLVFVSTTPSTTLNPSRKICLYEYTINLHYQQGIEDDDDVPI